MEVEEKSKETKEIERVGHIEIEDIEERDYSRNSIKKLKAGTYHAYNDEQHIDIRKNKKGKKGQVDSYMYGNSKFVRGSFMYTSSYKPP